MFSANLLNFLFSTLFVVAVIEINEIHCDDIKVVTTNDGDIRGLRKTSIWKKIDYYSFKGIPYAEPPTGELRFKPPKPVKSWKPKALDASEFGNICWQNGNIVPIVYPMSEDCLFLNVYVPAKSTTTKKLPVLFFIHGGGYTEGYGNDNMFGPDFIVESETILVTINYRLGVFGFLSLNSPEYSGNMGLKDQQLALKWIHENIEHFNGDKNKITIVGHSAGGASAHFQVLSAESRKYFHNAILMSGTALNHWAMSKKNDHTKVAHRIAKKLGKPADNFDKLIETLKSATADKLVKYSTLDFVDKHSLSLLFAPVIERADAEKPFLTQSVSQIYKNAKFNVDTLFTLTSAESLMFIPKDLELDGLNKNFTIDLPFKTPSLSYDSEEYRQIAKEIRQFYFGTEAITARKLTKYIDLSSDMNFAYFIDKAAKMHATKTEGSTYYSRFSVDSKLNGVKQRAKIDLPGAAHGDDLFYLLYHNAARLMYENVFYNSVQEDSRICIRTIEHMIRVFRKFATLERAQLGFEAIENDKVHFLDVTNHGLIKGMNPNQDANTLWSNIEKKLQKYIQKSPNAERHEL